jgi:N-acetylglutamate synthase-like GNAT family acetyltransferase
MSTEKSALKIRRATPLDAVNLYRMVVDDERKAGTELEFDEAARVAHILTIIASGYVSVVEKSGRIVGSFGFAAGGPEYAKNRVLVSEWCILHPSLASTKVSDRLVERLLNFADEHGVAIHINARAEGSQALEAYLEEFGFAPAKLVLVREPTIDERTDDERAEDDAIVAGIDGSAKSGVPRISRARADAEPRASDSDPATGED